MLYFKHADLVKQFHVSLRTVHNWIDAANEGRLNLDLTAASGKQYVANTARNIALITELSESRRKYRNSRAAKTISPKSEFYTIYDDDQIYDIATNLEIHHEIPRQYNYFNGGANHWDTYAERLARDDMPNLVNSTIHLLGLNEGYINDLLDKYEQINIVDIGVGNAYPVKKLLEHLLDSGKLGRYIALDISAAMLDIARDNIAKWFGARVNFEGYVRDINYERFSDLLIQEYTKQNAADTVNVVLLLGGTLSNMRVPDGGFKVVHDSMGINDILIHSTKLDTEATRHHFDFDVRPGETKLAAIHGLVTDLLNIDPSYYSVETGYDAELKQRFERIRLKIAITLKLSFHRGERLIEMNKNDTILTWRGLQQTSSDINLQFEKNDFYLLHSSQTRDREYILTVSRVKCD